MLLRRLIIAASAVALTVFALAANRPSAAAEETFSAAQRSEIESIVRDYLLRKPELLQEVLAELEKRQAAAEAAKAKTAVQNNAKALFSSPQKIVIGNPQGDVTLVEFFDYNCGYCKRALGDLVNLVHEDPKLRVVLKDFPVLGQGSVEAAQVAIAVQMQNKDPKKFFEFHQKLLVHRGKADKARALAVAKEVGYDVARIERDMNSTAVRDSIAEDMRLAEALGLNGTPSYVVGDEVVIGAVGHDALKQKVSFARCGQLSC